MAHWLKMRSIKNTFKARPISC